MLFGRKGRISVILAAVLSSWTMAAFGQELLGPPSTQVFHTQMADIVYDNPAELEELARKLGAGAPDRPQADLGSLSLKIDGMLAEISRVLQRWPARPVRLTIRLLRDGFQVRQQQSALSASQPGRLPSPGPHYLISFYDPRRRTVFLSLSDARPGVLAHEMTHFVLLESPGARTSEEYQESLARYMEERFNAGR